MNASAGSFSAENRLDLQLPLYTGSAEVKNPTITSLTPLELFHSLDVRQAILLDSGAAAGTEHWTYLLLKPARTLCTDAQDAQQLRGWPLARNFVRSCQQGVSTFTQKPPDGTPPFKGGWAGYLGYSALKDPRNSISVPNLSISYFDVVLAWSHRTRKWWCSSKVNCTGSTGADRNAAICKMNDRLTQIASEIQPRPFDKLAFPTRAAQSNLTRAQYLAAVQCIQQKISQGEVYEVNFAQRFTVPWTESPVELYLRMRERTPAEYGAYIGPGLTGGAAICCVSPELFLQVRGRNVVTRPIKGTRQLGRTEEETARAAAELNASPKERAELNMVVDVLRNDLGRVCEFDSVRVDSAGTIERLPTLLHRVATISGKLRRDCSPARLLRATFPGGSITGAPKLRAMQIIQELEAAPRGPYCGCIGWVDENGDMDLNIAIRTAIHDPRAGLAHYYAGGGIVADSDPEKEYEECLHKAAAFFAATDARL